MKELLSKLLNQRVVHTNKALDSGTIKDYQITTDGTIYIFVSFDKIPSKNLQFQFPGIFIDSERRMSSESPEVNEIIEKIMRNKACEICKQTSKRLTTKYGRRVCQKCLVQFDYCSYCRTPIHPKEAARVETSDENRLYYTCKDCMGKFEICPECGDEYYFPWREEYWPEIPKENLICGSCFEDKYIICSECEEYFLEEDIITIRNHFFCKECAKTKLPKCPRCGAPIPSDYKLCRDCENIVGYEDFITKTVLTIEENPEKVIRKSYQDFCRNPHTNIVNRLCKCREPYADCLLVDIGAFSLVIIYLEDNSKADYMIRCRSYDSYTMTQVKNSFNSSQWRIFEDEQSFREFSGSRGGVLYAWEKTVRIEAITDHVNDYGYYRNWFGETEGFFVIGTWHAIKRESTIFCNNKSCPYKDCRHHVNNIQDESKRKQVTQIDMQCTCARYTQYLADQINRARYK